MAEATKTTTKSDDNIMAALAYLFAPLTSIVLYLMYKDKGNKYVMFHAVQSGIYGVAVFVLWMVYMFASIALSVVSGGIAGCIMAPLALLLGAAFLGSWVFLMYKAYSGVKYKLPVIGDMAEKHAG